MMNNRNATFVSAVAKWSDAEIREAMEQLANIPATPFSEATYEILWAEARSRETPDDHECPDIFDAHYDEDDYDYEFDDPREPDDVFDRATGY